MPTKPALPLLRRSRVQLTLIVVSMVVYALAFETFYSSLGASLGALSMLPVALAAQFFGVRAGLATTVLMMVLNTFLYGPVEDSGWVSLLEQAIPAQIALVLIALVVGRLRDLTQRLHEELGKRQRAEMAALESEERYRQLADTTFEAIMIDDQNKILETNQTFCRMLGYSVSEVIGKPLSEMAAPEYRERMRELMQQQAATGILMAHEGLALRKDGTSFLVEWARRPITYRGSAAWLTTIHNIVERRRAEAQRLELAVTQEKRETLRDFLRSMSHDLKTPLSIITVNINLLEKLTDIAKRDHALQVIKQQSFRLGKLIQDILTISELDSPREQTLRLLDINQLIRNTETNFESLAEAKQLTVKLDLKATLPRVLSDEESLYRVLLNLVENAVNYTPKGGTITLRTYQDDQVIVEISDTGIGIEEADLPFIFDAFYRADKARSAHTGGSGLGLAIVKKILDMEGSTIEVQSTPGKGTTVRVSLSPADELSGKKKEPQNKVLHTTEQKVKVLSELTTPN